MIVSKQHRYIFIRCRKTASTSTEIHLSKYLGPEDVNTSFCERDEGLRAAAGGASPKNTKVDGAEVFYNHMPAREIARRVGEASWRTYFKFCFDRNPWDKAISMYFHRHRIEPRCSFDHFLASGEVLDCKNIGLYTVGGKIVVDFLGRYEHLAEDLGQACRRIGIPAPTSLAIAKTQFRVDRRPYREFLTQAQRREIGRLFADEIELLGNRY